MGKRSFEQDPKERGRATFTLSAVSGDYASERITFGACATGDAEQSFREITALVEGAFVTGATVELWLPRIAGSDLVPSARADTDYYDAAFTDLTAAGAVRWLVSAWPGAQIRVKSGGVPGSLSISASSF